MEQHALVLQQDIPQQSYGLQTYSNQEVIQQTLLYLHLEVEVHASRSGVILWSAQKLFDHTLYLMGNSDIIASRVMFLRVKHKIKKLVQFRYTTLDKICVNQNATKKSCQKMTDGFGGHLIICHSMP
jgi:hypothetical protein